MHIQQNKNDFIDLMLGLFCYKYKFTLLSLVAKFCNCKTMKLLIIKFHNYKIAEFASNPLFKYLSPPSFRQMLKMHKRQKNVAIFFEANVFRNLVFFLNKRIFFSLFSTTLGRSTLTRFSQNLSVSWVTCPLTNCKQA